MLLPCNPGLLLVSAYGWRLTNDFEVDLESLDLCHALFHDLRSSEQQII